MEKVKKSIDLPTFNSVEEIMADAFFLKCIDDMITDMNSDRDKVSEGGKIKLKRNAISFLIDMNRFNSTCIASDFIEIHYKRSTLPGAAREFISYFVVECIDKTFKHYEILFQKQNKKTSKSKKNGNT